MQATRPLERLPVVPDRLAILVVGENVPDKIPNGVGDAVLR